MAAEVLGGRVQHDVRALFQGTLQDRTQVGVVHHDQDAVRFGAVGGRPLRRRPDALDLHRGVGGRFEVDDAGQLAASGDQVEVQFVQPFQLAHLSAHGGHDFVQEMVRAAVQGSDVPHGAVGPRPREEGGADGGHAAGEQGRVFAVVPRGEARLRHPEGGVAQAAVDEPVGRGLCAFHAVRRFHVGGAGACVREHKGGCRMQGRLHRHVGLLGPVPREHCTGLETSLHAQKVATSVVFCQTKQNKRLILDKINDICFAWT